MCVLKDIMSFSELFYMKIYLYDKSIISLWMRGRGYYTQREREFLKKVFGRDDGIKNLASKWTQSWPFARCGCCRPLLSLCVFRNRKNKTNNKVEGIKTIRTRTHSAD